RRADLRQSGEGERRQRTPEGGRINGGATVSLRTKRVVVIGGTAGIGFAVAELALNEHAKVTVASSNPANVEGAVKRLAEGGSGVAMDVASANSIAAAVEQLGHIDHLVFTAGDWKARRGPVVDMDLESARANF